MTNQAYISAIKPKDTSAGTMYDLELSDGEVLGMGKFPPKGIAVGDYVTYGVEMRGRFKNLASGSLSKIAPPAGVPAPSKAPVAHYAGGGDNRQEVISKQAALNSALSFVGALIAADALPIPKTAKNDRKADLLSDIVQRYTGIFYHQSTGNTFTFPDKDEDTLAMAEADGTWEE
jgi:hypothetical protein